MMELWHKLSLLVIVTCVCDWSTAANYEGTEVRDTCGLTKLLEAQREIARIAQEQVVKKDGTIRQLNTEIDNMQKTLKIVNDSAELAQQHHKDCLQKIKHLENQVTVNDAAAHQQIINILSLANHIDNKTCDCLPQFQNLKEEISDLIDSKCNNKKLPDQLVNTTEEMKLLEEEEILDLRRRLENQTAEAQHLKNKLAAQVTVDNYRRDKGLANDNVVVMDNACQLNNVMVVTAVLDLGFNCVTSLDSYGNTCLHMSAWKNNMDLTKMLIARSDCDIDVKRSPDEMTPLMMAAYYGQLSVAEELLNNNADVTIKSKNGLTAVGWAKHQGKTVMANFLVSKGVP